AEARPLTCERCGSARLHRSRMRTAKERWLKLTTGVRAWRCDECGTRQLSNGRPPRRARSGEVQVPVPPPAGGQSAPPPSLNAAASPLASPEQSTGAEARPRRRKRDPLAEKIRWRRRRRLLITVLLVLATGIIAGWLVIRSHAPSTADITEVE
ncbi:MAG: hypothetical protein ACJ790_01555, partial [Myxococcaceae bacterium]